MQKSTLSENLNPNSPRPLPIQKVEAVLKKARPWGIEAEVMWSALTMAAEANAHGKTIDEVLEAASIEWDI